MEAEDIALLCRKIFQQTFERCGQKFAPHHTNAPVYNDFANDPLDALLLKLANLLISCRSFQQSRQISTNWSLSKLKKKTEEGPIFFALSPTI